MSAVQTVEAELIYKGQHLELVGWYFGRHNAEAVLARVKEPRALLHDGDRWAVYGPKGE